MEISDQAKEILLETIKKIQEIEQDGGGYVLISVRTMDEAAGIGELLGEALQKPLDDSYPPYIPIPYDMFEYGDEEAESEEAAEEGQELEPEDRTSFNTEERYIHMIKSLSDVEILVVYGVERQKVEAFSILNNTAFVPRNDGKIVVIICLATMVDDLQEQAVDFWSWVRDAMIIVPNLGLMSKIRERYVKIAQLLRPGSELNIDLVLTRDNLKELSKTLEKISKVLASNPKFMKVVNLGKKYQPIATNVISRLDDLLKTTDPLLEIKIDNIQSNEELQQIDRSVRKALKQLAEINQPLKEAISIVSNLAPLMKVLNKAIGVEETGTNPVEELKESANRIGLQGLDLVLNAVEVGSVSSSKTLISRALAALGAKKWDWKSLAHQLSLDTILVSKLIGAAGTKIRDEGVSADLSDNKYAFVNAIKVLGEDNLRIFLNWQANAVRIELGPAFRPIFDGIYLHTVYTLKVAKELYEILRKNNAVSDIDPDLLQTAIQMHNVGSVFLAEYVANFLASQEAGPPRDRHPYLMMLSRAYPRKENVFEDFATSLELIQYEKMNFGYDHTEIGRETARKLEWPDSDPVTWIITNHHHASFVAYPRRADKGQPLIASPVEQLNGKNLNTTLQTHYLVILADQIFEKYAHYKERIRTAEELKEYQEFLGDNPAIDKTFLKHTQNLRSILGKQTIMEDMVDLLVKQIEDYRRILPNAKQDFAKVAFGK